MKAPLMLATLLLTVFASAPTAHADVVDPPPCYEVYSQTHLGGGYWLVRRNSCSAQLYHCPDGYSPPAPPCEEVGLSS